MTELITMLVLLVIWLVAMAWKGEFFITLAKQYYIRKIESWDTSGEPHDVIVAELEALRAHAQANRWLRQVSKEDTLMVLRFIDSYIDKHRLDYKVNEICSGLQ